MRGNFSRESSHQPCDIRVRSFESPKKSIILPADLPVSKLEEVISKDDEFPVKQPQGTTIAITETRTVKRQDALTSEDAECVLPQQKDKETGEEINIYSLDNAPLEEQTASSRGIPKDVQIADLAGLSDETAKPIVISDLIEVKGATPKEEGSESLKEMSKTEVTSQSNTELCSEAKMASEEAVAHEIALGRSSSLVSQDTTSAGAEKPFKDGAHRLSLPLNELIR